MMIEDQTASVYIKQNVFVHWRCCLSLVDYNLLSFLFRKSAGQIEEYGGCP